MRVPQLPLMIAALMLAQACGSSLTEEEILARSGVHQTATAVDAAPVPGRTMPPVAASSPPDTPQTVFTPTARSTPAQSEPTAAQSEPTAAQSEPTAAQSEPAAAADQPRPSEPPQPANDTACRTEENGPIRIGSVGNYSGAGGASMGNFPRAVQLWATMINQGGGLCGRPVEVLVEDDGGDPARYGAKIRELVESRGIVAFVGNGAVLSWQGGDPYHTQSGVPVFGNDCTVDFWYQSPVLAPTCSTPATLLAGMMIAGRELSGGTKFGYVYCREAQACHDGRRHIEESGIPASGLELVYEKDVSISQVDFTAECQNARDAGAEIFTVGADAATGARFTRSCARQNWFPQYLAGGVIAGPGTVSEPGFEDIILGLSNFPFEGASGGAFDEYNHALATYGPQIQPDPALASGWSGSKLFELVATRAAKSSGTITPASLVAALHTVKNENLGGLAPTLNFGPNGADPAECYFVMQGDGTGEGFTLPFGAEPRCL